MSLPRHQRPPTLQLLPIVAVAFPAYRLLSIRCGRL